MVDPYAIGRVRTPERLRFLVRPATQSPTLTSHGRASEKTCKAVAGGIVLGEEVDVSGLVAVAPPPWLLTKAHHSSMTAL